MTTEREYLKPAVQEEIATVPVLAPGSEELELALDEPRLLEDAIRELGSI